MSEVYLKRRKMVNPLKVQDYEPSVWRQPVQGLSLRLYWRIKGYQGVFCFIVHCPLEMVPVSRNWECRSDWVLYFPLVKFSFYILYIDTVSFYVVKYWTW